MRLLYALSLAAAALTTAMDTLLLDTKNGDTMTLRPFDTKPATSHAHTVTKLFTSTVTSVVRHPQHRAEVATIVRIDNERHTITTNPQTINNNTVVTALIPQGTVIVPCLHCSTHLSP